LDRKRKNQHLVREAWRRFRKNKTAVIGLVILTLILLVAVFADLISPYEKGITQNARGRFLLPSLEHPFGTDNFGRDIFTRVIHGVRVSLTIGFMAMILNVILGGILGALASYYGGIVDSIIMRLCDVLNTIPPILLTLAIVAALGPGLTNMMVAIVISTTPGTIRFIRSVVITVVDQEFIEAARAYGSSDVRIICKHVMKNALGPIIIQSTMGMAGMILVAASLSFIGMGIQPPHPELGAMLSEAKEYMRQSPFLLYFPGGAILLSVLSLNLVGDGLRDALDPRLKS
jgi:peptide/nickel transport system permease protein